MLAAHRPSYNMGEGNLWQLQVLLQAGGLLMHPSVQLFLRLSSYCFGPHIHLALARAWWIRLLTLDQPVCH